MAIQPTQTNPTGQQSSRGYMVDHIVLHHAATTSLEQVVGMMVSGSRQVSSNYVVKDQRIAAVVPENMRSWSLSSSLWDGRSITFEICNESIGGDWPVSAASHETVARMCADICTRYGIPVNRDRILGHREVYSRYGASYATACPGGLDLDRIVRRAQQILAGETSTGRDDDMPRIYERGANTGDFALVPTPNGYKRFKMAGFPNDRNVIADAHGPIIQMFPADFDNMEKYIWSQLVTPVSSDGGGSFPTDYAKEATVVAVGKLIPSAEQNGAAARAAIVKQ